MAALRRRLSFANVISVIALFIALGGGAVAASVKLKPNQVKTKNIAPDAVTGDKALESSFGTVPSANHANTAATADDAASVGGVSADDLQFGNGLDDARAGVVDANQNANFALASGPDADDQINIHCAASPTLQYAPIVGPFTSATFPIEVWINGTHTHLSLSGGPIEIDNVPLNSDDTVEIQSFTNAGVVSHVVASVSWDAGNT